VSKHQYQFELIVSERKVYDRRIVDAIEALREQPQPDAFGLGQMVGLSQGHFQHLFKREVGLSVRAYVRELRLNRAAELLRDTHLSIKEIRNNVGIPDASNFVHLFRKRFGTTPTEYRNRLHRSLDQRIAFLTNK